MPYRPFQVHLLVVSMQFDWGLLDVGLDILEQATAISILNGPND